MKNLDRGLEMEEGRRLSQECHFTPSSEANTGKDQPQRRLDSPSVTNAHKNPHPAGLVVHRKPSEKGPAYNELGDVSGRR